MSDGSGTPTPSGSPNGPKSAYFLNHEDEAVERRTLAVIQAGYESASSGHAVNLTQRFGAL